MKSDNKIKVCLVCVCYNAYLDAERLLKSINQAYHPKDNLELWVVLSDNSTINADFNIHKRKFNFIYVKNENVGYFPGFNLGVKATNKDIAYFDYIMVSNVDLTIDDNFFYALLLLRHDPNIGVIAPRIISVNSGRDWNPKMKVKPSKCKILMLRLFCIFPFIFSLYQLLHDYKKKISTPRVGSDKSIATSSMYGAHGAFMIFTRAYFRAGATINYPRFLFGEEVFVAEELKKVGLKIAYEISLVVNDREHGSTSLQPSKLLCNEHRKSYDYFLKNFLK